MSRPLTIRIDAFMALAHPVRRRIVAMLAKSDHTAGEISKRFAMTPQAVSQHLRTMRRARLVSQRRVGRSRMYRLNKQPLQQVDQWLRTQSNSI